MSGSQPIPSSACPAYVLPKSPYPGTTTLTPRPDGTAGTLTRAVSSPEIVSGGDELPFCGAGGQAAALEAIDPPQELGVGEDRFDDLLPAAVERPAFAGV